REQPRLDQVRVLLGCLAQRHQDGALGQRLGKDELLAVEVLELRELARVETADVGPPPLFVRLARGGKAFVGVQRLAADVAQPARFALELLQGLARDRHLSSPAQADATDLRRSCRPSALLPPPLLAHASTDALAPRLVGA